MSKKLKEVMEVLEARNLHPAMRPQDLLDKAKSEGNDLHPLVLCPTRNNPILTYIHPERMLQELDKRDEFLNLVTLQFEKKAVKAPEPAPAPEPTPDPVPEVIPPEPESAVYTKEELEAMNWEQIRTVAKADKKIPGNKKKVELIRLLTGRPKFPLAE